MGLDRREDFENARNQQDGRQMHSENEVYHRMIQECKKLEQSHSMAWCLFTDLVLKCDCSFPDKFFVAGRFQVRFVQNKSEIALQCDLALTKQ